MDRGIELEVRERYRPEGDGFALVGTDFAVNAARPDGLELLVLSQGERPIDVVPLGSQFITITNYSSPGFVVDVVSARELQPGTRRLAWHASGLPEGVEGDPYRDTYTVAARGQDATTTLTWRREARLPPPQANDLALDLHRAGFASAFAADEMPSMGVALFNARPEWRSIRLTCSLLPYGPGLGSRVSGLGSPAPRDQGLPCDGGQEQTRQLALEPLEKVSFEWALALPGYGKWIVQVSGEEGSEAAPNFWVATAPVVRYPSRTGRPADAEQSRFGVNWAPQRALPLLARAGIRWERHIFALWDVLATERGASRWSYSDAYLREAQAHGIRLLGYFLGYDERWTHGLPSPEEFAQLVGDVVARYRSSIHHWEMWNEPEEPTFFRGGVEDYLLLHQRGAAAARQADPAALVHMAGSGQWRFGLFVDRFFELGGGLATDIANVHLYTQPQRPEEEFRRRIQQSQRLLQRYRLDRPLWITEMCWPTHPDFYPGHYWVSEEEQAQFLARAVAIATAEGVEKVFWFGLGDNPGARPDYYPFNGCSLVDWDGFARLALVAYANLTWHLEGASYLGRLPLGDEALHAYLFQRGDEGVAVIWSVRVPRTVTLPALKPGGELRDLYGNPLAYDITPQGIRLTANGGPAYLTFGF